MPRRTRAEIEKARKRSESKHRTHLARRYGITPKGIPGHVRASGDAVCDMPGGFG